MTDQADLQALSDAATPGPWVDQEPGWNDPGAGTVFIDTHAYEDGPQPVVAPDYRLSRADAAYIAALVNWHRDLMEVSGGEPERYLAMIGETLRAATPVVPESRTVFTFPDGTVGPGGDWDRATGQVVPAAASPSPDTDAGLDVERLARAMDHHDAVIRVGNMGGHHWPDMCCPEAVAAEYEAAR